MSANRQVISLNSLREKHPDDWKQSVLTVCEYCTEQADVITIGYGRIIKFWCKTHLNEEKSIYQKYGQGDRYSHRPVSYSGKNNAMNPKSKYYGAY